MLGRTHMEVSAVTERRAVANRGPGREGRPRRAFREREREAAVIADIERLVCRESPL